MFRPNPAINRFASKGYQRFVTTMWLCKDGEISSSGFNYVIIKNLVGEGGSVTWVCADTHNGDGTFQNLSQVLLFGVLCFSAFCSCSRKVPWVTKLSRSGCDLPYTLT